MQSAVKPVSNAAATRGAKSLPIFVAGNNNIFGVYCLIRLIKIDEYVSVR